MAFDVFRALADPTRRRVLKLLRERDMSAGEIADCVEVAKSTLSTHFNVLKAADLVVAERNGTTIRYSLNVSAFEEAMATVMDLLDLGEGQHKTDSTL